MKAINLTDTLVDYLESHSQLVNPVLPELARATAELPQARMQISPMQGAMMHLLARLAGARRIVEIGCFTGYSAICLAQALEPGGRLHTLDVSEEWTGIARRFFAKAGLADRIDLRLGPALETLPRLEQEFGASSVDVLFIDADKINMSRYYELGLRLLRRGGLVIADNVLWGGSVADRRDQSADTEAIRRFNSLVAADERVDRVMINVADGLFLARKR